MQDLEEVEVDFPELIEYCNRMNLPLLETSAKVGWWVGGAVGMHMP